MMVYLGEIGNKLALVYSWAYLGASGFKKNNTHNTSAAHAFTFTWTS